MPKRSKNKINVEWTGGAWSLCIGDWILKINRKDYSDTIPFQREPADTYGEYSEWHFGPGWDEEWSTYRDGMECDEWCDYYKDWLETLPLEKSEWPDLFKAFQEQDFRPNSCGGCI